MKLVVGNSAGEPIDFEILPGDTFDDLQNRLFQNENLVLDMAKLEIPDKPLTMSTNVMEYYEGGLSQETKMELITMKSGPLVPEQLFSQESQVELEQLQEISPLKITLKDEINLEELEELELPDAVDMITTCPRETAVRVPLEESRRSEQETTPSKVQPENIRFPGESSRRLLYYFCFTGCLPIWEIRKSRKMPQVNRSKINRNSVIFAKGHM